MNGIDIGFGLAAALTVLMAIKANCLPYGRQTHLVAMGCLMLAAWGATQFFLQGNDTPYAWRYAVIITTCCAIPASFVAWRRPSFWTWSLAMLLGIEIGLHGVFWSLWPSVLGDQERMKSLKWWYVLSWNVVTGLQLLTIFLAGLTDVVARSGIVRRLLPALGRHISDAA